MEVAVKYRQIRFLMKKIGCVYILSYLLNVSLKSLDCFFVGKVIILLLIGIYRFIFTQLMHFFSWKM